MIRRIALRGFASQGIALARADLLPEITITADGVYWHPVGAEDFDLLVTPQIFPLVEAFAAVRRAFDRESEHPRRLASIFNCAEASGTTAFQPAADAAGRPKSPCCAAASRNEL